MHLRTVFLLAAAMLLAGVACAEASRMEEMLAVPAVPKKSTAAAKLDLPYDDVRRGLVADYCFSGHSRDCLPVGKRHGAPDAQPRASGLTKKRLAKATKEEVEASAKSVGPKLTEDRFGRPNEAYLFSRKNGENFFLPSNANFTMPTRRMTYTAWMRLDTASQRNDKQFTLLSRNYPTFSWTLSKSKHYQRLNHERTVANASYTCDASAATRSKQREDKGVSVIGTVNGEGIKSETDTPTPTQVWQHVAFTSDGCAQHFYLNGELTDITQTKVSWPADDGKGGWSIGSMGCGGHCSNFNGALDDVRIYDRALSVREVKSVYGACEGVCLNGGKCRHVKIVQFVCDCPKGFAGLNCQTKTLEPVLVKKKAKSAAKKNATKTAKKTQCAKKDKKCIAAEKKAANAAKAAAKKCAKGDKKCVAAAKKVAKSAKAAAKKCAKGDKKCVAAAKKAANAAKAAAKKCAKGDKKCVAAAKKAAKSAKAAAKKCAKGDKKCLAAAKKAKKNKKASKSKKSKAKKKASKPVDPKAEAKKAALKKKRAAEKAKRAADKAKKEKEKINAAIKKKEKEAKKLAEAKERRAAAERKKKNDSARAAALEKEKKDKIIAQAKAEAKAEFVAAQKAAKEKKRKARLAKIAKRKAEKEAKKRNKRQGKKNKKKKSIKKKSLKSKKKTPGPEVATVKKEYESTNTTTIAIDKSANTTTPITA